MHPAEHRALRELHAFARELARHWERLATRLGGADATVLAAGAADARELVRELSAATAARGLHGTPAAATAGRFVTPRPATFDSALERNQALRFAVLDAQHCVTLLGYLRELARSDGDAELESLCAGWEGRLRAHEDAARSAAVALGARPDEAIEPADRSPAGAVAHRVAVAMGSAGEWIDRRAAARRR